MTLLRRGQRINEGTTSDHIPISRRRLLNYLVLSYRTANIISITQLNINARRIYVKTLLCNTVIGVHCVSPSCHTYSMRKSRPLNALTEDVPANGLSVQRATAIKLLRVAVKLDTCAQLSEAGS